MANATHPLRDYQRRIYQESLGCNALVVLPTGSGKTRIAAQHIISVSQNSRSAEMHNGKVLFLVPTCLLVDQQAQAMRSDTGLEVRGLRLNMHNRGICHLLHSCAAALQDHFTAGLEQCYQQTMLNSYLKASLPVIWLLARK